MNWIKKMYYKANETSGLRNIQLQFLGILLCVVIGVIGYKFYKDLWTLDNVLIGVFISIISAVLFYIKPIILKPLLVVWLLFGLCLGEITSTIILGLIFYLLFFPITFILRIVNAKKHQKKPQWISREDDILDYKKLY